MNINYIKQKQAERVSRIQTYVNNNNVPGFIAAMYVDEHAPVTTNKKMLAEAGFIFDEVTAENYLEVINALNTINVEIITNECTTERIITVLNKAVNEEVHELWGGDDVKEIIDCFPESQVLEV